MAKHDKCVIDPASSPVWEAPDGSRTVSPLIGPDECGANEMVTGLWILRPGHQSEPDIHPDAAEIYYVVSGEGKLLLDDEEYTVKEGMTVYIPQGVVHQTFNTGESDLGYYFIFAPPPGGPPRQEAESWNKIQ
ncbi:MAG TPA: hypothetical protein DHW38_12350 [Planctomycetaceae bacterium]|jgi:mannose-6-phosphate isomerase-like protein (cupin superfamily)|nr:cupin domain-containing protein [Pirellulales bacterium]HCK72361.1 hypothetical protein [Planctomycetaceae bacterium]HCP84760.1 hypothetical protein [Planctomycetaceae bacterium]|tara:strand:- start:155 stop:553 length:399 start_codon:yes stop_codon:yes gene_type:complete